MEQEPPAGGDNTSYKDGQGGVVFENGVDYTYFTFETRKHKPRAEPLSEQRDRSQQQDQESAENQDMEASGDPIPRLTRLTESDDQHFGQPPAKSVGSRVGGPEAQQAESSRQNDREEDQGRQDQKAVQNCGCVHDLETTFVGVDPL
jgi:hypothetical protein